MSKKKRLLNLLILDASGSMSGKTEEVRSAVNEQIKTIRKDQKKYKDTQKNDVRIMKFDTSFDCLRDDSCKKIDPVLQDEYGPGGLTALYDAIGNGISGVEDKYDGAIVTIFTDGGENASREYNRHRIHSLIDSLRKKGWVFLFMGCDERATIEAGNIGINVNNVIQYSNTGLGSNQAVQYASNVGSNMRNMYATNTATLDSLSNVIEETSLEGFEELQRAN